MTKKLRVHKTIRPVVEEALANGWEVVYTGNGHLKFTHRCGALVFVSSTPSDKRALKNIQGDLRREYRINTEGDHSK